MPRLIEIRNVFEPTRQEHALISGARLAAELMRLFPEPFGAPWWLYEGEVSDATLLASDEIAERTVEAADCFVLVVTPGTAAFFVNAFWALFFTTALSFFQPRPRRPQQSFQQETRESGNNQIAGQSNVLRPGARVPELLGRVRSYPDLLTYPVEEWTMRQQTIEQYFVIGMGRYDITNAQLGETPLESIGNAEAAYYYPNDDLPAITVARRSSEISSMSLMPEASEESDSRIATFNASAQTMTTQIKVVPKGYGVDPATSSVLVVQVSGTAHNDNLWRITSQPLASQTTPPFVYGLAGDALVQDEVNVTAVVQSAFYVDTWWPFKHASHPGYPMWNGADVQMVQGPNWPFNGGGEIVVVSGDTQAPILGYTKNFVNVVQIPPGGGNPNWTNIYKWNVQTYHGGLYDFGASRSDSGSADWYGVPGTPVSGGGTNSLQPTPTSWYRAPMADPQEVWIDVSFPQGLAKYEDGAVHSFTVEVKFDFCRPGANAVQDTITLAFEGSSTGAMRWTRKFRLDDLTLPAGTGVDVRLTRLTPTAVDTATTQFISETRWEAFNAIRVMPGRKYPDVTIARVKLINTRSAVSLGENTFNVIATRVLPTWNAATGWSGSAAATRRWADNFVRRCQASDGAGRSDEHIDLAGIYALQAQLDAMDGGAQGQISLTLDQQQDIDAELAQVADVVRASVYRVGRKIHVVRDQATSTRIALFNGRTKSPDGESYALRMKGEDEHDAVLVTWVDEFAAWKTREYQYPEGIVATNLLRVAPVCANWPQVRRRAEYEFRRLKYRREQIACNVTEDGRLCRPGDVIHMTDDVGNLAISAGEVLTIAGTLLTLDHPVTFVSGTYTLLVRDVGGVQVDAIPVTAVAGHPNQVQLSRASSVMIKGRDEALGTLYAFYADGAAIVRPWLLTEVLASGPYVQLSGFNYSARVYDGDTAALDPRPPLF